MKLSAFVGALLGLGVAASPAGAHAYPAKPVRLVVPFLPGGPADVLGRALAQKLGEQMGQQVLAESRPGAGGTGALGFIVKTPADGSTMALFSPIVAMGPFFYPKLKYDPQNDLAAVSKVAIIQNVLIVHPSVAARTLQDLSGSRTAESPSDCRAVTR